ncbi:MAG: ABC transporter ligand-binding protein [Bacillota bacterium]|nr:MAG: ABC transporter ligand-binding protein [Bacillota bacterium]
MKKILVLFLVLSLVLVGCSASVKTSQGVTATGITVGTPLAVSGPFATVGIPFLDGITSYFKMINDQGGVNGRMISLVTHDHEMNVEKGKAAVDKMLNDTKVFALVGHFGTPVVNATIGDIKVKGTPAVYFATGTGTLYNEKATGNDRVLFPVQPIYPMEGRIQAAYAHYYFGAKNVGIIYTNDDAGKDLLGGIKKEAATLGMAVVAESLQPGSTDATSAVLKMTTENVDMIIYAGMQATYKAVVTAMETQGFIKPLLMSYINADPVRRADTLSNAPSVLAAGIYTTGWVKFSAMETAPFKTFETAMKANNKESSVIIGHAWAGWTAAHIFVEGLKRVPKNELNWEKFLDAMENGQFQTPFGGTVNYANGARLGVQQLNLARMSASSATGWVPEQDDMRGLAEIKTMSPQK